MKLNKISGGSPSWGKVAGFAVVGGTMMLASSAHAMLINPTFGSVGSAGAFSAADKACINQAIALYNSTFNDPITVNITFNNMNTGLGQSNTAFFQDTYANVHAKLIADSSGNADDVAALASLAGSPPVSDGTMVFFSEANGKAMGYAAGDFGAGQDSIIGLNASICFNVHTAAGAAANPSKYDLFGVACHEIDEALGTVSNVGGLPTTADFFRYEGNAAGSLTGRSSAANTNVHGWFSINGSTALDEYNQFGRTNGDWGDWVVHSPNQVQDWQGTQGSISDPNVELRLLDVVGYRQPVPEPATMSALGLGVLAVLRRRRKG